MPVTLEKVPKAPAQIAQAVLDEIAAHPENFSMYGWVENMEPGEHVALGDDLGSYMLCAASWTALVTGWTIYYAWEAVETTDRHGHPHEDTALYAEKGGERRHIDDVAEEVLKLRLGESFWADTEDGAIKRLREIAGRE